MKTVQFGIDCKTCSKGVMVLITRDLQDLEPALILRALSPDDQKLIAEFWTEHAGKNHRCDPVVAEVEEMKKA